MWEMGDPWLFPRLSRRWGVQEGGVSCGLCEPQEGSCGSVTAVRWAGGSGAEKPHKQ